MYRKIEKSLQRRARYYGFAWKIDPSDLEGVAREAFLRAVETYEPNFGASRETWQLNCINQAVLDECKRIARNRKREIVGGDVIEKPTQDFCIVEMELANEMEKTLSRESRILLNGRLQGYPDYKIRYLNWRSRAKAQEELENFARNAVLA